MNEPAATVSAAAPRTRVADFLEAMRPRQWVKNIAVLAALVFSHQATVAGSALRAVGAAVLFCLLGSATYLANDLADRERDRLHPQKRTRPVADGRVSPGSAAVLAAVLGAAGLGGAFALSPALGAWALSYLLLQALYTLWLKHVVILDIGCIAFGFVVRVVAGAAAIAVPISSWLQLCTLLLALFLALGKRRAELVLLDRDAAGHRSALAHYSVELVDQMISVTTAGLVLAYSLYTVDDDTIRRFGSDGLKFTVPFVLFGIFRYLYLLRNGGGGSPEKVLLGDRPVLLTCIGWAAVVVWTVYLR